MTSSQIFCTASAHSGVLGDGFHRHVSPQTAPIAAFHDHTAIGKLNAVMIAIVLAFPQLVGHQAAARDEAIIEVPIEGETGSDYLLPPEWR